MAAHYSPELLLMLLADARLPAGGHTQSAGLEPALRDGLTLAGVPGYLTARLRTVVPAAAGAAVVVARAVLTGKDEAGVIASAWQEWTARTPSQAVRETEERLGRGYRRLVERLWGPDATAPLDAAAALLATGTGDGSPSRNRTQNRPPVLCVRDRPGVPRPLVVGVLAGTAGLSPEQTARLLGYDDVQTVVAACLKLEPIDPLVATSWTLAAFAEVEAMARRVAGITRPQDIPSAGAPQIDVWAQAHAHAKERLFSA